MATRKPEHEHLPIMPSQDPDRVEAAMYVCANENERLLRCYEVIRYCGHARIGKSTNDTRDNKWETWLDDALQKLPEKFNNPAMKGIAKELFLAGLKEAGIEPGGN